MKQWIEQPKRDEVVQFVQSWSEKVDWSLSHMLTQIGLPRSKYYQWQKRVGQANQHNAPIPSQNWLTPAEKAAIVAYHDQHLGEGYRRLSFLMLDADKVAASPSTVYRVLKANDRLQSWQPKVSKKGTGFNQPQAPHAHWHIDIAYLNICGTFYYLCSILDGFSRYLVHWEIRESMTEADVEIILQRASEAFPDARPRIISDNGPQFVARDFKLFIRNAGMQHVRTSPYYPQSNGKLERWHRTVKQDAIRQKTPLSLADARQVVHDFVTYYNEERLHSAIGYITPFDKLYGRATEIFAQRQQKLQKARDERSRYWQSYSPNVKETLSLS
jgi:transposase InsO family protein